MITKSGTAKALEKRKKISAINTPVEIPLHGDFALQNDFVLDKSRFVAAQCSRRAGKTNALALRFIRTMSRYPKSQCIYLALTRDSARDIMWPVIQEMNDKFKLGFKFIESRLTVVGPNGAKLILLGADMKNFVKRLKGRKYPGAAVDETQDFGIHLQSLIDDVLTPSIADYEDGWLALTGTPGPVPKGYFFDVTNNGRFGYSVHKWTLLDNPYMPNPEMFIADLMKKREWNEENATLRREYRNLWVLDLKSLWIQYKSELNDYDSLPNITPKKWNYIMGVDLGYNDSDALGVIAWHDSHPKAYLVEELITPKQGITELVNQIEMMIKKYDLSKIVMDEGGLGKKIGEELRRQKAIPVHGADKKLKQQNVEFLNDAMRTSKFMAKAKSRFAQDSYLIQIDWEKTTPDRIVIKKQFHSDIIDAVLYAFKECPIFAYEEPKVKLKPGSREWAEEQEAEMFEAELKKLQEEQEFNRMYGFE